MFKVEEVLKFTKNALLPNTFVVEDSKQFVAELEGFYVLLPTDKIPQIREYVSAQPRGDFYQKIFDNNPVNGLKLLLSAEHLKSYTELFVQYYGGIDGVLDAFSTYVKAEVPTDVSNVETDGNKDTATENTGNLSDATAADDSISHDGQETPEDYIDDSIFSNFDDTEERDNSNDTEESNVEVQNEQITEMILILRGIACKMGIMDYDDFRVLSKSDMLAGQRAIDTLSPVTVKEALLGAMAMCENKEDLAHVTRFLELFFTYIKENGLTR